MGFWSTERLLSELGKSGIRFAIFGRWQVVIARTLIAQRTVNDHELRGRQQRSDLAGLSHADQQSAARRKQLFGNQDRKRRADGTANNAVLASRMTKRE
jgi:hypothetical protein